MSVSKEIKSTLPQLRGAFKRHSKIADEGSSPSHHLLRFYANECGLKALFIKENNLNDTGEFIVKPGIKHGHGHDLLKWMDELKIPGFIVPFTDKSHDPLKKVHEKLRYGVDAHSEQLTFLSSLHAVIKKHL